MLSAIAPCLAVAILSIGQAHDVPVLEYRTPIFGKTYVAKLWSSKVLQTPEWDENDENPPVSARKALALAKKTRDSTVELPSGFEWKHPELFLRSIEGRWVWFVYYYATPEKADSELPPSVMLMILMDGTPVPLEVEKDKPEKPFGAEE